MIGGLILLLTVGLVLGDKQCYWNADCPYLLYSTKCPYETIRGDIRDYVIPENCEAISLWSLNRHGNRNPGNSVTDNINALQARLKPEIIASYEAGRSQLCAQDIEDLRKWTWNSTMEVSQSYLTATGYEEIYEIAQRRREKYPHLYTGESDQYYFRPTDEQRTITSAMAYIHGVAEGTNLNLTMDGPWDRDDVIRPYSNCDRYQQDVKNGQALVDEMDDYYNTAEFIAVRNAVQARLGITTQLTSDDIYHFYEICRFYRSWSSTLQSPWCSVFSDEDLIVLEYRDDVRHYHRNGYGSWVNGRLGELAMKDLYENFEAVVNNTGRKVVAYFTHDTMMEMAFCAVGLFQDAAPIRGTHRDVNRIWRTSFMAAFSNNLLAVLNRCQESGVQTHRVQFFVNEKVTSLCPASGCTWDEFVTKFQPFVDANLDFCSMDYVLPDPPIPVPGSAAIPKSLLGLLVVLQTIMFFQ